MDENHNTINYGTDDLTSKLCSYISYKIGKDWKRFGCHLDLNDADLDNIDCDNKEVCEKATKVLKKWKEKNKNPSWKQLRKMLKSFERLDIVRDVEREFSDQLSCPDEIIERRIPYGSIFKFVLNEDKVFQLVEYKCRKNDNWLSISNSDQSYPYYLERKKHDKVFVKVENLIFENEKIYFRFSFNDSKKNVFYEHCACYITGDCYYESSYNNIVITTPEPIFNNEFNKYIKTPYSFDWRTTGSVEYCLNKIPRNESIESFAYTYIDRNFPDLNDVICLRPSFAGEDSATLVIDIFY
nr:uncharacterized protein LOC105847743 isoform X2 [Hydra vulgaris]